VTERFLDWSDTPSAVDDFVSDVGWFVGVGYL